MDLVRACAAPRACVRLPESACGSPSARAVIKIVSRFFGLTKRDYISVTLYSMEMACGPRERDCGSPSAYAAPRERVRLPERACGHKNSVPIFWLDQKGLYPSPYKAWKWLVELVRATAALGAHEQLPKCACGSPSARAVIKIAS